MVRAKFNIQLIWAALAVMMSLASSGLAQDEAADAPATETTAEKLTLEQRQKILAAKFERFEATLLKIAEYTRKSDPDRAELLIQAVGKSRESDISPQMALIINMLENRQWGTAADQQEQMVDELKLILDILQSEDERERLKAEIARIQDILKDVNRITSMQKGVRADTERGGDFEDLKGRQAKVADATQDLNNKIDRQDAEKNSEGSRGSKGSKGQSGDSESKDDDDDDDDKENENKNENKDSESGNEDEAGDEKSDSKGDDDSKENEDSDSKPNESGENKGDQKPRDGSQESKGSEQSSDSQQSESQQSNSQSNSQQNQNQDQQNQDGNQQKNQQQQNNNQSQEADQQQQTPGREELERAREKMEEAIKELEKKARDAASDKQDEALAELEAAKEKLEEILRQLREEERELLLAALEVRFRRMLEMEYGVKNGTLKLARIPEEERITRHAERATQLSRDQDAVILEADKALVLLREEGSSVAFPEAVQQMQEDMEIISDRLRRIKVDELTQAIEDDVIESLKEMIEALRKEMEKLKEQQQQQQQQQQGEPQDPALVDQLAELKLLRSLQQRINRRTRQYGRLIRGEQADDPETIELLRQLGGRQDRIRQAAYDLATGRNN